jgi:hypothetical protein
MCLIYAGAHLLVGLPLHLLIGALPAYARVDPAALVHEDEHGALPAEARRPALALIMIAFAGSGFIGWGVAPNLVNMLAAAGAPAASAIFLASLHGPAQIAGRLLDYGFGSRLSPLALGLISAALAPLSLVALIFVGESAAIAVAAIGLYGMSTGLNTVTRASIPLNLFGRTTYGATLGRIALPMNIACAAAPIFFAALMTRAGPAVSLAAGAAVGAIVVLAFLALARRARPSAAA